MLALDQMSRDRRGWASFGDGIRGVSGDVPRYVFLDPGVERALSLPNVCATTHTRKFIDNA